MFATVGLQTAGAYTATSMGTGFVSFNQASTFTLDRTPIAAWEGVWIPNMEIAGVHAFVQSGDRYGFLASTTASQIHFAAIRDKLKADIIGGKEVPIEWDVTTARSTLAGIDRVSTVGNGSIDLTLAAGGSVVVEARTAEHGEWIRWSVVTTGSDGGTVDISASFGTPPKEIRNATWLQLRLTGIGHAEIHRLDISFSEGSSKGDGKKSCNLAVPAENDYFRLARISR
jgi:hypothetical protein